MSERLKNIKVDNEQLELLMALKDKKYELRNEVHADLFPPLMEGIRQIRELTQNIALISGAIAAFTIPVVNTTFIQVKFLAYFAIITLFFTIAYAIYHLVDVITKEINELNRQHTTYITVLDEEISKVNEVIETGDIQKLLHSDAEANKILNQLNDLKIQRKPDHSLDILKYLMVIALGALVLSFIPSDIYKEAWKLFNEIQNTKGFKWESLIKSFKQLCRTN